MRVIVTGGGTGGHIYPALAIAEKFKEIDPNTEILYIGNVEGIEKDIVPNAGYNLELVTARWFDEKTPVEFVKTGAAVTKGIMESKRIIKRFKPDVIIGTGGFVCVPMLLAGRLMKVPTYIHEQNAYPGLANRFLEGAVNNIFLGFGAAREFFKQPSKLIDAGNPVRKSFFTTTKKEAREKLGIPQDDFVVFTFGGSIGSMKINEIAFELLDVFNGHEGVSMIIGTGKWMYKDALALLEQKNIDIKDNISVKSYIDNMDLHLLACDLVICRSGALSVAETTVCGKAAIFVPFPEATGNHQYFNAKAVADEGGAILIEEKDLVLEDVVKEVLSLKHNPEKLKTMSAASRACAPDKALDIICGKILEDCKK